MLEVEYLVAGAGSRLVARTAFKRRQVIWRIQDYRVVPYPTYQTIQIGPDAHLEDLGVVAYLNHSCRPNIWVNTTDLTLIALRDIAPGEELTYFYPSTEWDMARPFACLCGAPDCLGRIAGARYLAPEVLSRYRVNRHIRQLKRLQIEYAGRFPGTLLARYEDLRTML